MNFLQLLQKCPEFTCGVHRDLTGSAGILTNNKTQIGAVEIANDAGNLTNFCHGHGNHGLYDIAGSGAVGGAHQGEHIVEGLWHYSKLSCNNTRIYEKRLFGGRCGKADCPFR